MIKHVTVLARKVSQEAGKEQPRIAKTQPRSWQEAGKEGQPRSKELIGQKKFNLCLHVGYALTVLQV